MELRVHVMDVKNYPGYNAFVYIPYDEDVYVPDQILALDMQRDGGERFTYTAPGRLIFQFKDITPNATIWVNPAAVG